MRMSVWLLGVAGIVLSGGVVSGQGLSPEEAAGKMKLPPGFESRVVAAEPLVRQPVAMDFDDRGRLWVIQYLQYPNPEGLKRVQVDRYSRTKYDRVPEPPPNGPRGADRITILEDSDGDGRMDSGKDFINGLNLTTGFAFGHGGVFVLNVPYLLFYPDRDRDDVPDGDPEVLLTGFGMEDAHSVANSLTFGPDGWLYGCQGSTVTANVRGIEFQQGVWRYHPVTKEFELFCEGGGNTWGLDFDRTGRLLYSTNYGGFALVHGVQGGYYVKSFGKHGALHNPHAYGYFEHAPHNDFQGGHVTVGGIVYQGDALPESFRGKYIAGDLLGHGVRWHNIVPWGSTVKTENGGELVAANDPWFATTDVMMGPDGAIYVSDWHDARTAHPDPDADWDRSNGRIFRIAPKGTPRAKSFDLSKMSERELYDLHRHPSQWYVRRARQELVRRFEGVRSPAANELIAKFHADAVQGTDEVAALEAFWSLNLLGGFNEEVATEMLASPHAAVRWWTLRLLGDKGQLSEEMAHRLDGFAEQEQQVEVRQQLACSAARFPAAQAVPMINANINRDIDGEDPFLPLLWWWAVEKHSVSGREEVLKRFVRPTLWKSHLGRDVLLPRLIRRYAAEKSGEGLDSVVRLLKAAPDEEKRLGLWEPILLGWQEQKRESEDGEWLKLVREDEFAKVLQADWTKSRSDATLQLGIALKLNEPVDAAFAEAFAEGTTPERRAAVLTMLGQSGEKRLLEPTLELVEQDSSEKVRSSGLQVLGRFDDPEVAARLIKLHQASKSEGLKSQIRDVLLGRAGSARAWIEAVERKEIPASVTPLEQIRRVALLGDEELDSLVTKNWGKLQGASREEKLAEVRRLNNDVRAALGNPKLGKDLFKKHCAGCHQLFGEGAKVGPDLTTANRQDRDFLLVSLVDPSSVIRKEYVSAVIVTRSGRVVTGLPIARDDSSITLVDSKSEKLILPMSEVEELNESPVSLMPDDLYRQFKPQELRDLFAYLQSQK